VKTTLKLFNSYFQSEEDRLAWMLKHGDKLISKGTKYLCVQLENGSYACLDDMPSQIVFYGIRGIEGWEHSKEASCNKTMYAKMGPPFSKRKFPKVTAMVYWNSGKAIHRAKSKGPARVIYFDDGTQLKQWIVNGEFIHESF
jgi:hypothetical protein